MKTNKNRMILFLKSQKLFKKSQGKDFWSLPCSRINCARSVHFTLLCTEDSLHYPLRKFTLFFLFTHIKEFSKSVNFS